MLRRLLFSLTAIASSLCTVTDDVGFLGFPNRCATSGNQCPLAAWMDLPAYSGVPLLDRFRHDHRHAASRVILASPSAAFRNFNVRRCPAMNRILRRISAAARRRRRCSFLRRRAFRVTHRTR